MKCTYCNYEMGDNTVCPNCGTVHTVPTQEPVMDATSTYTQDPTYAQTQTYTQTQAYAQAPTYTQAPQIPAEYKPISPWGYFGWNLLFSIPCIGFIVLIVFALGGTQNINLKNYARSFFCMFLLILIISIVIFILAATGAIAASNFYY